MATELTWAPGQAALCTATQVPFWDRENDQELVCTDVRNETHDVKTFTFRARADRYFSFEAGQYFSFDFAIDGQEHNRCYSVSTSALMPHSISITVKRVEGGTVSNWLHDHFSVGTAVRALGPLGKFKLEAPAQVQSSKYLFISGGSGITPLMSMLRTLADARQYPDIVFFHASRSTADVIFEDELRWRAKTTPGLRLVLLPERMQDGADYTGVAGRVNEALLSLAVPDLAQRTVMCCGPSPFMSAVRALAGQLGVPSHRYLEENFTPADASVSSAAIEAAAAIAQAATMAPTPPVVAPAAVQAPVAPPPVAGAPCSTQSSAQTFSLHLTKQEKTIEVQSSSNLLAAMRQAGLHIPSSCGEGLCGTCKTKLVSGQVDMQHNGGIRKREIEAGFFLPCCSTPLSDVVIDR